MRHLPAASLAIALLAVPLWADSRVDKAVEKAREQVEKGQPDDAVRTLTKAAEEAGAEGYLALGRLLERLGRLDEAAAAYAQARAVASPAERPDALAAGSGFALRAGTGKEALGLAHEAVEAGATATTLAALARAQARVADGRAALETADRAVAADAGSVLAHVARGEALFGLGRNAEAEAQLREAIRLDPGSAPAWSRLARVQIAQGKPGDAVASARKATQLDEHFGEGFAILGGAILAADRTQWGEAIAQAQQGAFLDPKNPIVQTAVGRIFDANGQAEQAVAAYRRALEIDPGFAPARLALIETELARGNRDVAIAEAETAAAEGSLTPEIELRLGEMAERRGNHDKALAYLESALRGMPGNADGWALLGRAYQFKGRSADAADAYARAVELAPQNLDFRTFYGLVLGLSGDLEGGLAQLERVVKTPGYRKEDAWVNLGWIYRSMDRPEESIAAYRKALEIEPKQVQAALGLGWAYTKNEQYEEAIAAYEKAVALDPSVAADAWRGSAVASVYERDLDKAREYEKKTIAAGRSDPQLHELIGQLEQGVKDYEVRLAAYQKQQEEAAQQAREFETALGAAQSKDPKVRARAAHDLMVQGAPAVDALIYIMRTDPDWNVRIAATRSLGGLGPVARKAVPHINGILRTDGYKAPLVNPTDEQVQMEMLDGDFRRELRQALVRIEPGVLSEMQR